MDKPRSSFKFRKKERIIHPQDFRNVMRSGRRLFSKNFVMFIKRNKLPFHRLGIVVSKEVGSAPYRNRAKRLLREFFRLHKHKMEGPLDIVILVKRGCSVKKYSETAQELRGLLTP